MHYLKVLKKRIILNISQEIKEGDLEKIDQ